MIDMSNSTRRIPPSPELFRKNRDVSGEIISKLEGIEEGDDKVRLAIKPLIASESMLFMEAHRPKGLIDPEHAHSDHESICYLVSGKIRVVIEGKSWVAEPGDVWVHPPGVKHYHEALEDSVQIEIKSPPTKTWS
jgi:quercetin dioxygenase-like cupin family protein